MFIAICICFCIRFHFDPLATYGFVGTADMADLGEDY